MKIRHIANKKEFSEIFTQGKICRGRKIAVYRLNDDTTQRISIGLVLSKKYLPKAVQRNYVKRVIYAYFRESAAKIPVGEKIIIRVTGKMGTNRTRKEAAKTIIEEIKEITK